MRHVRGLLRLLGCVASLVCEPWYSLALAFAWAAGGALHAASCITVCRY
jgi:hypothetical protein